MNRMTTMTSSSTTTSTTTPPTPLTFDEVAKLFMEKANTIIGRRKLAGSGSEYANIAVVQGAAPNIRINPVTGLRMHCNNPKGVKCTNPACTGLPRVDNHDHPHCYWPGGGMESKAPAWVHNKGQKSETATVTVTTVAAPSPTPMNMDGYRHELSCATITEVSDDNSTNYDSSAPFISTLLDSGTTSHLITGRDYFLNFRTEDNPGMHHREGDVYC